MFIILIFVFAMLLLASVKVYRWLYHSPRFAQFLNDIFDPGQDLDALADMQTSKRNARDQIAISKRQAAVKAKAADQLSAELN